MQSAATAAMAMAKLWWAREPDEATTPTSRPPPVELDVLEINVGGQIFTTTPQTLKKQEQSMLAQMFAGGHSPLLPGALRHPGSIELRQAGAAKVLPPPLCSLPPPSEGQRLSSNELCIQLPPFTH
jgi:hypothetical protein